LYFDVLSGVPQGSILGLFCLTFLLMIYVTLVCVLCTKCKEVVLALAQETGIGILKRDLEIEVD
jgi:hypothetical protein